MKKIAFFVGELIEEYGIQLTKGIQKTAMDCQMNVDIFQNFGENDIGYLQEYGERILLQVPEYEQYDGFIISRDTFGIPGMYEELIGILERQTSAPIVCVRAGDNRFYSVMGDDYKELSSLVEHFIVEHHCQDIRFVTGRMDLRDAKLRLKAYKDTMERHGISVTEDMIYEGDYWRTCAKPIVDKICEPGKKLPEAIVCSNDYEAIAVCQELQKRKIRVPEEVKISGYDGIIESRLCVPGITSVEVNGFEYGKKAIEILDGLFRGEDVPKTQYVAINARYLESCGCHKSNRTLEYTKMFDDYNNIAGFLHYSVYMNLDFENTQTFKELMSTAHDSIKRLNYSKIYVVLCDEEERGNRLITQYTDTMILKAILTPEKMSICNKKFDRHKRLLPEKKQLQAGQIVVCLHLRGRCQGYIVLQLEDIEESKFLLKFWKYNISAALERIRINRENKVLSSAKQQAYTDEMTGIPNRRRMNQFLKTLSEKAEKNHMSFAIISIDMNNLKLINDHYGHIEGDQALYTLAQILKKSTKKNGLAARMGGDEFMIALEIKSEREIVECMNRVRQQLNLVNQKEEKEYLLTASMGYDICHSEKEIVSCVKKADEKMYEEKQRFKAGER